MLIHLRRSLVMAVICLVFFGFVYALVGTGVAQLFFRGQADGSITANGSTLIGQNWSSPSVLPRASGRYRPIRCRPQAGRRRGRQPVGGER